MNIPDPGIGGSDNHSMAGSSLQSSVWTTRQFFRRVSSVLALDDTREKPFPGLPRSTTLTTSSDANGDGGRSVDGAVRAGGGRMMPPPTTTKLNPLTKEQQCYFVRLFWSALGQLFPVLTESEFQRLYDSDWQSYIERCTVNGALVDCITAVGLQYGLIAGRGTHILGLGASGHNYLAPAANAVRRYSLEYFIRCRNHVHEESSRVTVETIRCYVMMVLYLLQTNQVESAYYMIAIGVRCAYVSQLHAEPPVHLNPDEAIGRSRLWWLLCWLDLYCSMQLDLPTSVQHSYITCPLPVEPGASTKVANPSGYIFHIAKLVAVVSEPFDVILTANLLGSRAQLSSTSAFHECAEKLSPLMRQLEDWLGTLPTHLHFAVRTPVGSSNSRKPTTSVCPIRPFIPLSMPDWMQRQRIMLELHYYNACILLQRPFLFCGEPGPSPVAGLIDAAVQCATDLIVTVHAYHLESDIFSGLPELVQFQWNAIVTLAVLLYINPMGPRTGSALQSLALAQATFESWAHANIPGAAVAHRIASAITSRLEDFIAGLSLGLGGVLWEMDVNQLFSPMEDESPEKKMAAEYAGGFCAGFSDASMNPTLNVMAAIPLKDLSMEADLALTGFDGEEPFDRV
ncbi:fungal specific transcription factor [Penicillium longicatenatum]|uniref:fungal specific transcription factor n=1 Tax=Penicillium longicatenatum TaxID=1561947 RepID=UPI0025475B4A|nr:fungal specific transcription factor [Penicillium longicatenatum]KAJ5658154.1 fungal specific transcription factor [Penicillium longicatenatum]